MNKFNIKFTNKIKHLNKEKYMISRGYYVFGKEYGVMLRNDLYDMNLIEHKL